MADTSLQDRQHALEDAFYREDTETYRVQLELRQAEEEALEDLATASGISDEAVLRRLAGLGIRADTLAALTLIPLIEVAWADGKMDAREREAILFGAESTGIPKESPSHGLLRIWIEDPPAPDLVDAWSEFISALCHEFSEEQRGRLQRNLLGRARAVAWAPRSRRKRRRCSKASRAPSGAEARAAFPTGHSEKRAPCLNSVPTPG
jgi:hypothetical protein